MQFSFHPTSKEANPSAIVQHHDGWGPGICPLIAGPALARPAPSTPPTCAFAHPGIDELLAMYPMLSRYKELQASTGLGVRALSGVPSRLTGSSKNTFPDIEGILEQARKGPMELRFFEFRMLRITGYLTTPGGTFPGWKLVNPASLLSSSNFFG